MKGENYQALYESISHRSEHLPLKIYHPKGVYLHWHEEYEFVMVKNGSAVIIKNGTPIELSENQVLCLYSGDVHSIRCDASAEMTAIVVSPLFWEDNSFSYGQIAFQSLFERNDPVDRAVISILEEIVSVYYDKAFGYDFILRSKFTQIFAILLEHRRFSITRGKRQEIPDQLKKLLDFVHEHYAEKISLDLLSSVSFYSKTYIIRLFKKYTCLTPAEYILQYRLDIAKKMLRNGEATVLNIAYFCGFNSETYFIRAFKKQYGMTPYAYKASLLLG